jgi:hypothetical protein
MRMFDGQKVGMVVMARMRTLKPQFFLNEGLAEIEPLGRLLFQGLWCLADRVGRLEDRPRRIKAEVLPYDDADVEALLDRLHQRGFIQRYEVAGGRYIVISTFTKHQSPHVKEAESIIPAPGEHQISMVQAPCSPDESIRRAPPVTLTVPDPVVDIDGGDSSGERMVAPALTLGAFALTAPAPTPRNLVALPTPDHLSPQPSFQPITHTQRKSSTQLACKPRAPDALWDACVVACNGNAPTNDVERGKWNKGLAALRQSGATAEEIGIRAVRYKRRYGEGIALNPMALAGNWTQLATDVMEGHDHAAGNNPGHTAKGNGGNGRSGGAGYRGSNRAANGIKPLPDADYWERYRQQLEREGRLAKPRNSGKLPAV